MPRLEAERVSYRYPNGAGLESVELHVSPGEIVGLFGPNGAGKSTLVGLSTGALEPTSGRILFDGEPLDRRHKRRIGAVFETTTVLEPSWSALSYLEHVCCYYPVDSEEAMRRARELLGYFDVHGWQDRPIEALSRGNQRKLEIVRSLLPAPELLILDEPAKELDQAARERLWRRLDALRNRGVAVLLATHRLGELEELADRVAALHGGALAWTGPTGTSGELKRWMMKATGGDGPAVRGRMRTTEGEYKVE